MLAAAAVLLAGLYHWAWHGRGPAASATVWVDGGPGETVALTGERRLEFRGRLGVSSLEIGEGRIRVVDSPGRRKLCVRAGWLTRAGESAVCLPNRVVVAVNGAPRIDAMNH